MVLFQMVERTKNFWQPLERKLAAGWSIDQAAEMSGVDLEDARLWLKSKRQVEEIDVGETELVAREAMKTALAVLEDIVSMESETEEGGLDKDVIRERRLAAQALLRHSQVERQRLERKLERTEKSKSYGEQTDLFDHWVFPEDTVQPAAPVRPQSAPQKPAPDDFQFFPEIPPVLN